MKRSIIKVIALLTVILFSFTVFAGCSTGTTTTTGGSTTTAGGTTAPASSKPDEIVKLRFFTVFPPGHAAHFQTLNDNPALQDIAKATNVEVQIDGVPTANFAERKNLLFASGDMPDIIYTNAAAQDALMYGVNDTLIRPLDDLIGSSAPNYSEWVRMEPQARLQTLSADGKQYWMPYLDTTLARIIQVGYWARESWLNKLNIKAPYTLDELYDTLKKFKEEDPAGGGNTLPLSAQNANNLVYPFFGSFGVSHGIYQEDGVIKFGPLEAGYREAIVYLNRLYNEGLIASDYLTHDANIYNANLIDNIGITFAWTGSGLRTPLTASGQKLENILNEWRPIAGFRGPDGEFDWHMTGWGKVTNNIGLFISTACKNPEAAMRYIDYKYSKEGAYTVVAGRRGEYWDFDSNGVFKVTDKTMNNPAGYDPSETLQRNGGMTWAYTVGVCGLSRFDPGPNWPYTDDQINYKRQLYGEEPDSLYKRNLDSWWDNTVDNQLPPNIAYSAEEQEKINLLSQDINTLVSENLHRVVMGLEPISKWDDIIAQLKRMNVDDMLKQYQSALDRVK